MTRPKQPNIIDQLRQAVIDSGKTQVEIAAATNLDQGNISKFLHGKRSLSLEYAAELCSYLDLKLARARHPSK